MNFVEVHSTCEVHLFFMFILQMRSFIDHLPIIFSDVDMENPYPDVMKQPSQYHFQYRLTGTGVYLRWYWTGT